MANRKKYNLARVLITGARAPVALEWAQMLNSCDKEVYLSDTLKYPIASFTQNRYFQTPCPKFEFDKYKAALLTIIQSKKITIIIPTCEEVFYLAFFKKDIEKYCNIFTSSFNLLEALHNKYKFNKIAIDNPVKLPYSTILYSNVEFTRVKQNFDQFIIKPIYSRFANKIKINPQFLNYQITQNNPLLIQEFINGIEFCSFSLFTNGEMLAYSLYQPKYRAGHGSGIYFAPYENNILKDFLIEFGQKTSYTGQVGFDFIFDGKNFYVLECNPRGTSGIHLLSTKARKIVNAMSGEQAELITPNKKPKMIKLAMLIFGIKYIFKSPLSYIVDFLKADDVIKFKGSAHLNVKQLISVAEIIVIAIKNKVNLLSASTRDIEYNGDLNDKI